MKNAGDLVEDGEVVLAGIKLVQCSHPFHVGLDEVQLHADGGDEAEQEGLKFPLRDVISSIPISIDAGMIGGSAIVLTCDFFTVIVAMIRDLTAIITIAIVEVVIVVDVDNICGSGTCIGCSAGVLAVIIAIDSGVVACMPTVTALNNISSVVVEV